MYLPVLFPHRLCAVFKNIVYNLTLYKVQLCMTLYFFYPDLNKTIDILRVEN